LLEPEHANVRGALGWLIARGDHDAARRLCSVVWRLWLYRGLSAEGDEWLRQVLALPCEDQDPVRVILLHGAALLARQASDYPASNSLAEASLARARELGDLAAESLALYILASNARFTGKLADAEQLYRAGIDAGCEAIGRPGRVYPARYAEYCELICREGLLTLATGYDRQAARTGLEGVRTRAIESGYPRVAGEASAMLGYVRYAQGDYAAARALFEASLAVARALGDAAATAEALTMLGALSLSAHELDRAQALLIESLRCANSAGLRWRSVFCLRAFVNLAILRGEPRAALRLAGAVRGLNQSLGVPERHARAHLWTSHLARVCHTFGPAHAKAELVLGRELSLDQAIAEALALAWLDARSANAATAPGGLSPRELEVVALIARGYHNRQIAEELVIAPSTAERHVANILAKLGFDSRSEVAVWAVEHADSCAAPRH
jgi:DNA-binding CsgD family transcriptional regulator